jgi:uncharacterized iron-regulated membrane protein
MFSTASAPQRLANRKRRRKFWLQCHLWLGLSIGGVLAIAGLTGSVLVFWHEIDAWLNPALRTVASQPPPAQTYRPLEEIVDAARAAFPPGSEPGLAEFGQNGADSTVMFFGRDMRKSPTQTHVYNVFVNPFTAKVQGVRVFYDAGNPFGHTLMGFVFKLHYSLLMKDSARKVLGWICALLLISVLTGLIVWWPLTGQWYKAFTLKRHASPERFVFDLHKTAGVYTAAALLAVLLSGVYLNLPDEVLSLVKAFSPASHPTIVSDTALAGQGTILPGRALAAVETRYPGGTLHSVLLPIAADAVYRICHRDVPGLAAHWVRKRCVAVDRYSGALVHVEDAGSGTAGDAFLQWQWYLHSGHAFGMPGRILVCAAGLAGFVLYVTGLMRWLQKRKARRMVEKAVDCRAD